MLRHPSSWTPHPLTVAISHSGLRFRIFLSSPSLQIPLATGCVTVVYFEVIVYVDVAEVNHIMLDAACTIECIAWKVANDPKCEPGQPKWEGPIFFLALPSPPFPFRSS